MKERPILFSGPMVRAILNGEKTQTRRVLKPQPTCPSVTKLVFELHSFAPSCLKGTPAEGIKVAPEKTTWLGEDWCGNTIGVYGDCPYGVIGDQLWVKETWAGDITDIIYKATHDGTPPGDRWKSSIFMPRWASRITLEITDIRIERLQDISEKDAISEGLTAITKDNKTIKYGIPDLDGLPGTDNVGWAWDEWKANPIKAYQYLWDSINGKKHPWESNPFVWGIEFKRLQMSSDLEEMLDAANAE